MTLTYEQASSLAIQNDVTSMREYMALCFVISELPEKPQKVFTEFKQKGGWKGFLQVQEGNPTRHPSYDSMEQLRAAIEKTGILTYKQYIAGEYRRDPKMPGNPFTTYKDEFKKLGGANYLFPETSITKNLYKTYLEVKNAVAKLGIKNSRQYYAEHHRDPRLPASPHHTIPAFKESGNFAGLFN